MPRNIYLGLIKLTRLMLGESKNIRISNSNTTIFTNTTPIIGATVTYNNATYDGTTKIATNIVVTLNDITLTKDVDYIVVNNGGINAGDYTFTIEGIGEYDNYIVKTFTISKVTPTVTAPTAKVLTYNGSAQALVNAGSTNFGTLQYSLDNSTWSTTIPTGTNAGSYTVYYRVVGDSNINDVASSYITCSISKVTPTVTAPTAKSLTYSGYAQTLVNAGSTNFGTLQYSSDNSTWSTTVPTGTNAGSYTVYYRVVGNSNINDVNSSYKTCSIGKKSLSITAKSQTITYGSSISTSTSQVTTSGLVSGDSLTSITLTQSTSSVTSSGYITPSNAATSYGVSNYNVSYYTGSLTIRQATGSMSFAYSSIGATYNPYDTTDNLRVSASSSGWEKTTAKTVSGYNVFRSFTNKDKHSTVSVMILTFVNNTGAAVSSTIKVGPATESSYDYVYISSWNASTITTSTVPSTVLYTGTGVTTNWTDVSISIPTGTNTLQIVYRKDGSVSNSPDCGYVAIPYNVNITSLKANTLTTNTNASVSYSSSNTSVASVSSSGDLTINGLGSATITASASSTTQYSSCSASYTITVSTYKVTPTYTAPASNNTTYNGSTQYLTTAGSTSHGTIYYSLDGSSWSTSRKQGTNAGTYTSYWKLTGDAYHSDISSTSITTTISKATPTTNLVVQQTTYPTTAYVYFYSNVAGTVYETWNGTQLTASNYSSASQRNVSVTAGNGSSTNECTVDQGTYANSWTIYIYFVPTDTTNYNNVAGGPKTLSVAKASRTISFSSAPSSLDVGSTTTLSASPSAGSGEGTITYSSSNSSVASISGSTLTGVGTGTCTITATISEGTNYSSASISYIITVNKINYNKKYVTIVSLANNNAIGWKCSASSSASEYYRPIYISTDNGTTWTAKQSSYEGTTLATLNNGDKMLVKYHSATSYGTASYYNYFTSTEDFDVEGNIMSMIIDGDGFTTATTISSQNAFNSLFRDCTKLKSAENLMLPATTLADYCYSSMLNGCTSLTTAPELPATTLASSCYNRMFYGCTSLTTAPELPVTTLANTCYANMFNGCTGLTTAPDLPATTLAIGCYHSMFQSCTGLTTAPDLPATTLTQSCYNSMFMGCISLTTAPDLPATTLVQSCYQQMFRSCKSLNYIKCLAINISVSGCLTNWVNGVASTGTFVKNDSMTNWTSGTGGIPRGWTVQNAT